MTMSQQQQATIRKETRKKVFFAVVVTAGVTAAICGRKEIGTMVHNIPINIGWNNTNTITTELARRGHPGFLLSVVETGEVFASKRRLMEVLGVSWKALHAQIESGAIVVLGEAA